MHPGAELNFCLTSAERSEVKNYFKKGIVFIAG
jgi:hypothetical protein